MKNTIYQELKDFVKEHHGFGGDDFKDHPEIMEKYNKFMDYLKKLDGQRVRIKFINHNDFTGTRGEKIGRIKAHENGNRKMIKFYEGKHRTKHYWLDAGLFDGWFATLIPLEIIKL